MNLSLPLSSFPPSREVPPFASMQQFFKFSLSPVSDQPADPSRFFTFSSFFFFKFFYDIPFEKLLRDHSAVKDASFFLSFAEFPVRQRAFPLYFFLFFLCLQDREPREMLLFPSIIKFLLRERQAYRPFGLPSQSLLPIEERTQEVARFPDEFSGPAVSEL